MHITCIKGKLKVNHGREFGAQDTVEFLNCSHLASNSVEDLLTKSLYDNQVEGELNMGRRGMASVGGIALILLQ